MSAVLKLENEMSFDELLELCNEASHRYAKLVMRHPEDIDDTDRAIVHYLRAMPDFITRL